MLFHDEYLHLFFGCHLCKRGSVLSSAWTRYLQRCLRVTAVHRARRSALVPTFSLFDCPGGENLDLGHQFAEALGVGEQGAVTLCLVSTEGPGDRLVVDLPDPRGGGPVQLGRVFVATAGRAAAAGRRSTRLPGRHGPSLAISAASCGSTSAAIPKGWLPIRTSPESLRTMRR